MIVFMKTTILKVYTIQDMIQRILVVFCIYTIILVVMETMLAKMVDRKNHNEQRIDDNGNHLRRAADGVSKQFHNVAESAQRDKNNNTANIAAQMLIADGKTVIQKFYQCNSVTSGIVKMPMPLSECLLYTIVALIFITMSVGIIRGVSFKDRITNIRILKTLARRVDRGDAGALLEANHIIRCAQPNPEIWNLFTWFGIFSLVTITVWFMVASQNVASDYRRSLIMKDDCE